MVEVTRDQGNVEVPGLADGFAVVERLEHGEEARVFLHFARQRVEVAGAGVARQRRPAGERGASGGDGGVHVGRVALRYPGERPSRRGVHGGEQLAARRAHPPAAQEVP